MTPRMQEILYEISVLHDPNPDTVFARIVQAVGEYYSNAMATINLVNADCLQFRMTVNPPEAIQGVRSIPLEGTYCQRTLEAKAPMLIQDAARSAEHCSNPMIQLNLSRYLGIPIMNTGGCALGTLCLVDGRTEDILSEADIRFLSLLASRVSMELERERMTLERIEEHREAVERTQSLVAQLQVNAEEKRRFVSMVIHDLRHPLATIQTILYLLREEDDPMERELYLDTLENRTKALSGLLDGLTQCHKIEAGHIPLDLRPIDLKQHFRECVTNFISDLSENSVECRCEVSPEMGPVLTDRDKLTHITLNLLSNAQKFTQEGHICVRAYPSEACSWILEVEDTGIGIPAEDQERVFEEFYRAPSADHSIRPGSGLGLAIVKRLVDALQGSIEVESEYGVGTTFRIRFSQELQPDAELESLR